MPTKHVDEAEDTNLAGKSDPVGNSVLDGPTGTDDLTVEQLDRSGSTPTVPTSTPVTPTGPTVPAATPTVPAVTPTVPVVTPTPPPVVPGTIEQTDGAQQQVDEQKEPSGDEQTGPKHAKDDDGTPPVARDNAPKHAKKPIINQVRDIAHAFSPNDGQQAGTGAGDKGKKVTETAPSAATEATPGDSPEGGTANAA